MFRVGTLSRIACILLLAIPSAACASTREVAPTRLRVPGAEPRSALEARILLGRAEVIVTGIHLYRTEAQRLAQARALVARYSGENAPVILAGDFNSQRGSSVMNLLEQSWSNPAKQGDPNTFPADRPEREIDFMLVRPTDAVTVRRMQVVPETLASDHRPILIELELRSHLDPTATQP